MKKLDVYHTISDVNRREIKVKGSRFIGTAAPVADKDAALEFREEMRKEFYDATHNCYAYRIGEDGNEFRAADDGEPAGSAGKPILFMIDKYELKDVFVNVTRYFGGTKLGVGGLVRAYSDAAEEVLKIVKKKPIYLTKTIEINCGYEEISLCKKFIDEYAIKFTEEYTDKVRFTLDVKRSQVDDLSKKLFHQSLGKLEAREM
jgi:uncharacterized YigZ family protein